MGGSNDRSGLSVRENIGNRCMYYDEQSKNVNAVRRLRGARRRDPGNRAPFLLEMYILVLHMASCRPGHYSEHIVVGEGMRCTCF